MAGLAGTIATWVLGIIFVTGMVAGAAAAAGVSMNAFHTIGVTAGAVATGAPELIDGFNQAKRVGNYDESVSQGNANGNSRR